MNKTGNDGKTRTTEQVGVDWRQKLRGHTCVHGGGGRFIPITAPQCRNLLEDTDTSVASGVKVSGKTNGCH